MGLSRKSSRGGHFFQQPASSVVRFRFLLKKIPLAHDCRRNHYKGPGITDLRKALQEGYSTSGGLGLGLPGVRRLMDEFEVASEIGQGTTVTAKKWTRC